jgi:hypothetical protein
MRNPSYSHRDFTGQVLTDRPAKEFEGEIVGSCFSQEAPGTEVFPKDAACTFVDCNLDNVALPPGCTVVRGCARRFRTQTDGHDWEVAADGAPVRPLNVHSHLAHGLIVDPADLEPLSEVTGDGPA